MDIYDRQGLKLEAKDAISQASYDPRKLILIHTGATIVLGLILALLDYLLDRQIGSTGGLGGIGSRSVLETAQTVLSIAQLVLTLFWQISYIYIALRISRRQDVGPGSLLEGFRQFGPVLRFRLITGLLYTCLTVVCVYISSILFSLTPLSSSFTDAYMNGTEEELLAATEEAMLPIAIISLLVMLVVLVPYWYKLRMAEFSLMDDPKAGAMAAIRKSRAMMHRNRLNLFKLDVSFWWFFVLELLVTLLSYGNLILPALGITLPWSADVSYYVFLVLFYLADLALYWWRGNEVQVTYAMAYEALLPKEV